MYNYGYPYYPQQPRTDIGQVNSEQEAVNAYVAAGSSRIMFTADDKSVFVKSVSMNGQVTMNAFDRREKTGAGTRLRLCDKTRTRRSDQRPEGGKKDR